MQIKLNFGSGQSRHGLGAGCATTVPGAPITALDIKIGKKWQFDALAFFAPITPGSRASRVSSGSAESHQG